MTNDEFRALLDGAGSEDALFRVALTVEADPAIPDGERDRCLEAIGARIDAYRIGRGLGDRPLIDELLKAYDGPPPAPLELVRQDLPAGSSATPTQWVETCAGRLRAIPGVRIEDAEGGSSTLFPSPLRSPRDACGVRKPSRSIPREERSARSRLRQLRGHASDLLDRALRGHLTITVAGRKVGRLGPVRGPIWVNHPDLERALKSLARETNGDGSERSWGEQ